VRSDWCNVVWRWVVGDSAYLLPIKRNASNEQLVVVSQQHCKLRMSRTRLSGAVIFVLAFSRSVAAEPSPLPPEVGYNHGEQETPRSIALAGGLRALSNSTDAIFLNPANMAAARVYHAGGSAQIWPRAGRQSYGASAADSARRHGIAGGLAANWMRQDPDGVDRKGFDLRLALAAPLSEQFLVGGAVRYLSLAEDGFPRGADGLRPSSAAAGLPGEEIVADLTFDAGLTLKPIPEVSLALVGQNLSDTGHGFLPLMFGGGIGFGTDAFSLEMDVVSDFTTYEEAALRFQGGAEILVGDNFPIRGGYSYDDALATHSLAGGFGYVSRQFSLDAGLRSAVSGPSSLAFVIGFKYHVESTEAAF
jgi:hypothetical protein